MEKQTLIGAYRTRKAVRYAFYFVVLIAVFALLGFLVLPPVVKSVAVSQASKALHRPVSIEKIRINPFAMTLDVDGLSIREREGEEVFLGFDHFHANVDSSSLFKRGVVLSEMRLENPQARIVRLDDGRFNFSDLADEFANKPKTEDADASGVDFSLNNIQVTGGSFVFDDRVVREKHEIRDLTLSLPFISNMDYALQTFVEPAFSAVVDGAPLRAQGKSKPFVESLDSELSLELSDVKLPGYLVYAPADVPVSLTAGVLDTALKINFHNDQNGKASLQAAGTAALKDFDIQVKGAGSSDISGNAEALPVRRLAAAALDTVFEASLQRDKDKKAALQVSGTASLKNLDMRMNDVGVLSLSRNPDALPVRLTVDAVDTVFKTSYSDADKGDKDKKASLQLSGTTSLKNLKTRADDGGTLATFKQLDVALGMSDVLAQRFVIDRIALDAPDVNLHIDPTGKPGLTVMASDTSASARKGAAKQEVQKSAKSEKSSPKEGAAATTSPAVASGVTHAKTAKPSDPSAQPLVWSLGELAITNGTLRLLDESRGTPVNSVVDALYVELRQLESQGTEPSELKTSFKLNGQGEVIVAGKVEPFKPAADLTLAVKTLDLLPLQPYFGDKLNVELKRGQLTADGTLQLHQADVKGSRVKGEPALAGKFTGQATLGNLRAVEKTDSSDFLRWKSLYFGKINVDLNPLSVAIGEIALSDFFARAVVSEAGRLNLLQIVRQDDAVPPATEAGKAETDAEGKATVPIEPKPESRLPLSIEKITLQGGNVRFTDNFVKPNYTANLRKIGGNVTNLSSAPGTVANLELRGSYDDIAPLTIGAKINPLSAKPYLDLQAEVKGVELTSLSTYAAKYAGYAIEKGKLSLTVNYKIEDDQLQAQNRVFIDQLTFGENRIDSPEATSLPVKLAVSLLKNRAGQIDLDLPISGTLSDPEFSIGGVIVKVIVNLLSKAVTAPFALLGSLFEGGEEMSTVEFAPGRARISDTAEKRLENLAKALIDRHGLKLEITAVVDPEADREGLKRAGIDRKVTALKREQMGDEGASTERIEVSAEEYPGLLERVYRAEKFPKPRNMIGLTKSLPVGEMEKLMLANATVEEEDLHNLGDRRARRVRDWLIEHQVPAEQVFLLPTKMEEGSGRKDDDKDQQAGKGRVDFSLK